MPELQRRGRPEDPAVGAAEARYDAVRPPCPDDGHEWAEYRTRQSRGYVLRRCRACGARG